VKLLYFAWVRQKIGKGEEDFALPPQVKTVADLILLLRNRGAGFAEVFEDASRIRAALNHEHVQFDAMVADGDELAFFPPVTGG
jgi:molybdopterin synthase sulfur carrier subunit